MKRNRSHLNTPSPGPRTGSANGDTAKATKLQGTTKRPTDGSVKAASSGTPQSHTSPANHQDSLRQETQETERIPNSTANGTATAQNSSLPAKPSAFAALNPDRNAVGNWGSISLSLLLHALLATFLILFITVPGRGDGDEADRSASIVLAVNSDSDTEYLTDEQIQPPSESSDATASPAASAASAAQAAAPDVQLEALDLPGARPIVSDTSITANSLTETPKSQKSKIEVVLSEEDLKTIANDQKILRARRPKGDPASLNVFGLRGLEGRRFVFVIDRSNSMGAGGLGVIDIARKELTAAVSNLKPNHSFQVVAYHDNITTISGKKMLKATQANKAELPKFLSKLASFGGTSHEHGLFAGLSFRPDVLVLMTDGGDPILGGNELKYFRNFAKNQTQIHCLQFGAGPNQETKNFMMQLARENRGSYRYIDVDRWNE